MKENKPILTKIGENRQKNNNQIMKAYLEELVERSILENSSGIRELALGFLRYEKIRKLNPRQFTELCKRNLKGEYFDNMVDELILND